MAGSFVARRIPTALGVGSSGAAGLNLAEELKTVPWLMQRGFEGNVYIAGHGLEETATDGEAALDETTPTFVLLAPAAGTIVIPIYAEMRMHTEGGAAPDAYLSYVGVDRASTITKTDLDKLQLNGAATTSAAIAAKTVSAISAITSPQTVLLKRRANVLDNLISVEAVTLQENQETFSRSPLDLEYNFIEKFGGAFVFSGGRGVMFHTATATADSVYSVTFVWAEVPTAVYQHVA